VTIAPDGSASGVRAGSVALAGWTNVGKSTLLNRLVGDKLAAVSRVAQTTRHRITGVRSFPGRGQIVFVDTPGLHKPRHRMNRAMVEVAGYALRDVDLTVLVTDAARGLGEGDERAVDLLRRVDVPRLMVLNKVDQVAAKAELLPMMQRAVDDWGFLEVLPVSALTGQGCDVLVDRLLAHLPEGPPLFPEEYLTDQTERSLAAEWIREKLLWLTREELPHATAVMIDRWEVRPDGLVEIHAIILVDRESQRQIVIGRGGQLLKQVGSEARVELERLLGSRVYLDLWVKIRKDWRNDGQTLRLLGLETS